MLEEILDAIFAGHIKEAGTGDDRFARVSLPDGTVGGFGAAHLPLPWRWRRAHRYAPYGDQPDRPE